jgi:hypothetical protein
MNPNFTFDAEGVFDQPIKPLRIKQSKSKRHRQRWIALTKPTTLEASC